MPAKPRTTRRPRNVRNDDVTKELAHDIHERIESLISTISGPPDMTRPAVARVAAGALNDAQQETRRLRLALSDAKIALGERQAPSPPPVIAGRDFPAPSPRPPIRSTAAQPNPETCNGKAAKTHMTTTDANQQPDQPAHRHGGIPWNP